jgi:DeoD family purine-nucleoside phosphorylase
MARSLESSPVAQHEPIHLRPTATLAERVLLPGDPGRALALAQSLLERPLMFNHHRGLWGYTGTAADGEPLSIQSTGMGGPSAAIVLQELIALGVRRAIRVGTCGALDGALALGDLLIVREALAADGTSRALGAGERVAADRGLTTALERASCDTARPPVTATVVSTDLFYEPDGAREHAWRSAGAVAVEMETATLFALGAREHVPVACVLTVSDLISPGGRSTGDESAEAGAGRVRIEDDALLGAAEAMGRVALGALAI